MIDNKYTVFHGYLDGSMSSVSFFDESGFKDLWKFFFESNYIIETTSKDYSVLTNKEADRRAVVYVSASYDLESEIKRVRDEQLKRDLEYYAKNEALIEK